MPNGPKYRTCESCRTKPAIGVASLTGEDGEVALAIHVCEQCAPHIEGSWVDLYNPYCNECGIYHAATVTCTSVLLNLTRARDI